MAKVEVRYLRNGKVVSMDKRYADILVKTKRVEFLNTGFKQNSFKASLIEKKIDHEVELEEKVKVSPAVTWGTSPLKKESAEVKIKTSKKKAFKKDSE